MIPYEVMYGRKYKTPIYWGEAGERKPMSLEIGKVTTKNIGIIKSRLKTAKDR